MWIGTWENGLARATFNGNGKNREPDSFKLYKRDPQNPYDLSSQSIQFIFEDSKKRLWIGTAEGLDIYDRKNDRFKHFTYDINNTNSLSNYSLQKAIAEDDNSNYWIGTWNGLNKINLKPDFDEKFKTAGSNINELASFIHFFHDTDNGNSLSDNRITSLCMDNDSSIWLGLFGSGINRIEFLSDGELRFSCFNEQNGLSNNEVYCIFSDDRGNVWCSTNNGICEINIQLDQVLQYNENDGLQGKEFFWGAGYKSESGEIFFGGNNGLNSFFPSKIEDNNKNIPVVFTEFNIFNEKVKPDGTVLKKNISEASEVYLDWSDKVFSIEFAALYNSSPEVIKYKYRLLGFDKEWSTTNYKNRIATYTNLNPGKYEFQVKSTSLNGSWSEKHSSIIINIVPPFWMTWYFRILMAILIIGLVYLIVIIRLRSIKAHNRRLEILVKERTEDLNKNVSALMISNENLEKATKEAKKADKAKSEFLANMSHEIRTPLNGIIGLTNLMLDTSIDEEQEDYLHKLESSSKSLLYIINDILDFSKIEAGKLEIVKSEFSFDEVLKTIYNLFSFPIERKSLEFNFNIDPGIPRFLIGDEYRILQVVTNLVGNSIKFTSDGFIALKADVIEKNDADLVIEFCVQDSGIGIAEDDQAKLFESFTQADSSLTKRFEGTGLGLTIAKNLVELMGGKIWLKSKEGVGSEFYFTLKMKYRDEPLNIKDIKNTRLLVVDDNAIDQAYICRVLKSWGVESKSVGNGEEALSILTTERFDLMLVDWKMPVMNGLELLKSLHDDSKMIRHILMVNSFARKDLLSDAKAKGIIVETVIEKPATISEFYAAIKAENKRSYISNPKKLSSNLKKTYRALLAEDNVFNQLVQKKILEKMGFEIVVANNGKDAIDILKRNEFDIIFMDLHMPILDGYEATRIIRTFNADVPIIALSAAVLPRDKAHAEQVGINEHVSKPINFKELESVIYKYLVI